MDLPSLESLAELLIGLEPGDLVETTQLVDHCEKWLEKADSEISAALQAATAELKSMITNGPGPDSRDILHRLAAQIARGSARAEPVSEPTQASSEGGGVDPEVLSSFLVEAHDHLDAIEERILRLEKEQNRELVDGIFRSIHTIKGTSSFLGLGEISDVSHELESALDDVRENQLAVSGELVDLLLRGTDHLVRSIAAIENASDMTATSPGVDAFLTRIRQFRKQQKQTPVADTSDLVTDDMRESFLAETGDTLDSCERDLLELERDGAQLDLLENVLRAVHTIKGNAGFLGYGEIEQLCMDTESALQEIQGGGPSVSASDASLMIRRIDALRDLLSPDEGDASDLPKPLGELLVEMGEATPEDVAVALDVQDKKLGEILVDQGLVSEEGLERALGHQTHGRPSAGTSAAPIVRRDIRVDTSKLDGLFDLVGELITAESMLMADPVIASRSQDEEFRRNAVYLGKVTRELQQIAMSVRMIPLEGLFNKMRRLVRDLARKTDRPADIRVTGQDTEMDRNVIEEIADPLVHIIRNAIDHGIEDRETRQRVGKPEMGSISLDAHYEGNEIWITVRDDGRGLNRDAILQKAAERGVLQGDPSQLTDEDVWRLIFQPGFSTADQVTEISGRGVGMDVVRKNIEKLRGQVDVRSVKGEGSRVTLRIPLTLAIVDGVTVRVGSLLCAFPIADILEFHQPVQDQISGNGEHNSFVRIHDDVMPIVVLHDFFRLQGAKPDLAQGIFIVTRSGTRTAALLVDEIVGYTQVVVKPLPGFFGERPGVAGCTLLGSGEIGLIIDSAALVQLVLE